MIFFDSTGNLPTFESQHLMAQASNSDLNFSISDCGVFGVTLSLISSWQLSTQRLKDSWNLSSSPWTKTCAFLVLISHLSLHSMTSLMLADGLEQQSAAQRCISRSMFLKWFLSTALIKSRIAFWTRFWASWAIFINNFYFGGGGDVWKYLVSYFFYY